MEAERDRHANGGRSRWPSRLRTEPMAVKTGRAPERGGTAGAGRGGAEPDAGVQPRRVGAGRRTGPTRSGCSRSRMPTREPDLVPVRHGRMLVSPFTFYRGAAKIMAADLDGHAHRRPARPAVRRRASVELRRVRLARAAVVVRPERLRRDPPGAVRVRRQAHGGQLHHRRPQQRVRQGRHQGGDPGVGEGLPGGDGQLR